MCSPKFVAAFHRANTVKLLLQVSYRISAVSGPLLVENTPQPRLRPLLWAGLQRFFQGKTVSASTTSKAEGIFTSPLFHLLSGHITRLQTSRRAPRTLIIHSLGDKSRSLFLGMVSNHRKLGLWGPQSNNQFVRLP